MIEQQGKVLTVDGDIARVRLGGTSGCSACDAGKGCGAGLFGRLLRRRPVVLELDNRVQAQPDQPVVVGLPESLFLGLLMRLYLLPLLALLAGAVIGHYIAYALGWSAVGSDLAALGGALIAGVAMVYRNRKAIGEFPATLIVHILRTAKIQNTINGTRGTHCEK